MTRRLTAIEVLRRVRRHGLQDAWRRIVNRVYQRARVAELGFPLLLQDVADSTRLSLPPTRGSAIGDRMTIGWLCTPPAGGSGGHTTLFRMVAAAERAGHKCILFVYDRHGGDIARHESTIRSFWPWMVAEVRDARDGLSGVDAYVASSWETAHVLASRAVDSAARLYFIQDFEPYFHPRGTVYALAEDSYRFGFRNVALGEFVAKELELRGIASEMVPYGCDTSIYRLDNVDGVRSGVVYYTKPGSDRRGYLLGKLALEEFHRRHPEHPIHLYGDASDTWEIPTVRHGRLSPGQLNELYNGTVSGLAISFTNISLVAEELLAAGNVPVVTDVPFARDDLTNPHVEWAQATAGGLADALCRGVENAPGAQERRSMSSSVRQGWTYTEDALIAIIADAVRTGELVR